ncbi:MAG: hypothetical protein J6X49_00865 [Victivallales bacterium]|nr:hypothetical protein [Victivallales bacterium]
MKKAMNTIFAAVVVFAVTIIISTPSALAGSATGDATATTRVEPHSTDVFHHYFTAGKTALVIVSGDKDTDLDLYIYDENDNLIEKDEDGSDQCVVTWTPRWTGRFTIKVVNRGDVYNEYTIGFTCGDGYTNKTSVGPKETDSYERHFTAHERAAVIVSGDGDTDLDLYVYDENGNLIAKDEDNTDECLVTWTPRWTGKFIIKVVNCGSISNRYTIRVN